MKFLFLYFVIACFSSSLSYSFENLGLTEEDIEHYLNSKVPESPVTESLNDIYVPYLFDTGVGNRETLIINDIILDDSFSLGKGVLSWKEITFEGRQFLVGRQKHSVTLIQVKMKQFTHENFNTLYFNETFMTFEGTIGPIVLINHMNFSSKSEEGFALVTESTSQKFQQIHWLKITKRGLAIYDTWSNPTRGEIIDLKWITFGFTQFLLIITHEDNGFTTIDISEYKLDGSKMRLMCLDKLRVEYEVSSVSAVVQGEDIFMILVVPTQHRVWLYRYHLNLYKAGGFESILNFASAKVTKAWSFIQSGQNYILINGDQPNIYLLSHNGTLTSRLRNCGPVEEWLVLKVPTYREDVVLLARDQDRISLLTWKGSLQGFTVSPQPPCLAADSTMNLISRISQDAICLAFCEWSGAAVLTLGHVPVLILACNSDRPEAGLQRPGGLYHFNVSLHPLYGPAEEVAQILSKSLALQEKVMLLSLAFEEEGLLEDFERNRERLVEDIEDKENLEACLGQVEDQILQLSSYMDLRHRNAIEVSMKLHNGKLTGSSSGLLANQTVATTFTGKTRINPVNPAERIIAIDCEVLLDEKRRFIVRANLKLDTLEISEVHDVEELKFENTYGVSPEIDGPPDSYRMKQDMPLHEKVELNVHH